MRGGSTTFENRHRIRKREGLGYKKVKGREEKKRGLCLFARKGQLGVFGPESRTDSSIGRAGLDVE